MNYSKDDRRADRAFLAGAAYGRDAERELIAQAIEAEIGDQPILVHVVDWRDAMECAARIARSGGVA